MIWGDRVDETSSAAHRMSHICRCGVINTKCCDVILSGYYVLNIGDMMSQIYWIQYHPYSGCDVINRVGVMTDTMDVRSDTVDLMSYIKWCDVIRSGCDVVCSAYDFIHIVAVMSYIHWVQ